jgi:hypothetical protein
MVLLAALITACSAQVGPQGATGPAGPAGRAGPTGAAGPAGPTGSAAEAVPVAMQGAAYVGTETCAACHSDYYENFIKTGHAWKLNKIVDGQAPSYPFSDVPNPPEGYTWDDISYVIGGYNWKARFINHDGYIITDAPGQSGDKTYKNQYNPPNLAIGLKEASWSTYNSGVENKKYDCGSCHTTGYSPRGNQDGMPGMAGTFAAPGIQCEACHGRGSLHASNPTGFGMEVDRSSELCGHCHIRDEVEMVEASGGFIQHHEQYEELFQSKHIALNCVTCHDPHMGVVQLRIADAQPTRTSCENCHFKQAQFQDSVVHPAIGVACVDCHMPRIVKNARGKAEMFTGDIRVHLMAIDPYQVGQFTEDGKYSLSQISLDFACRSCHVEGGTAMVKTDEELIAKAVDYHARP